jgi:hypothetical protein
VEIDKSSSGVFSYNKINFGYQNPLIITAFIISSVLAFLGAIIFVFTLYASRGLIKKQYDQFISD